MTVRPDQVELKFTISRHYAGRLARWASVARTLNEAKALLEGKEFDPNAPDHDAEVAAWLERVDACVQELADLTPALDHMHQHARWALWTVEARDGTFDR